MSPIKGYHDILHFREMLGIIVLQHNNCSSVCNLFVCVWEVVRGQMDKAGTLRLQMKFVLIQKLVLLWVRCDGWLVLQTLVMAIHFLVSLSSNLTAKERTVHVLLCEWSNKSINSSYISVPSLTVNHFPWHVSCLGMLCNPHRYQECWKIPLW